MPHAYGADMGIAWDGDLIVVLLTNTVNLSRYYIVGLLAESFLLKKPGARIIYDPR